MHVNDGLVFPDYIIFISLLLDMLFMIYVTSVVYMTYKLLLI